MTPLFLSALVAAELVTAQTQVDLPSLQAVALSQSPGVAGARARGLGIEKQVALEQPSPWPTLRVGARVWPLAYDLPASAGNAAVRYRIYAQLRLPLLLISAAWHDKQIVAGAGQQGVAATTLARQLVLRDLMTSYAVVRAAAATEQAYQRMSDVFDRQLEVLKQRIHEGLSTDAELATAMEQRETALAAADELLRAGIAGRARIAALTGRPAPSGSLPPMPTGLGASSPEEAEQRARTQRGEVLERRSESARWKAQASAEWRNAIEFDLGVGFTHGTTGTLDELSGLSTFVELYGPLDGPWRAIKMKRRDDDLARAADLESRGIAERVAAEASQAFLVWRRAEGLAKVAEVRAESTRVEYDNLRKRQELVPQGAQPTNMAQLVMAEATWSAAEAQLAERRGEAEVAYATLLAAEGTEIAMPDAPKPKAMAPGMIDKLPPVTANGARGLWVWKTREVLDGGRDLLDVVRELSAREVYLSTPRDLLSDPRLPALVAALHHQGARVEALMGEATWYRPDQRDALLARVSGVVEYNRAHAQARFDGVHLDIEPQQLPENKGDDNRAFLPSLTQALAAARVQAEAAGLTLACDLPRKVTKASPAEVSALVAACPRATLMLYELPADRVVAEAKRVLGWQRPGLRVVVGVRAADFGAQLPSVLQRLDKELAGPAYGGWAVHDYRGYMNLR